MKIFYFTIYLLSIVFSTNKLFNRFNIKNESLLTNGIYIINSLSNNQYFTIINENILLSNQQYNFRLIYLNSNSYYIESRANHKKLVVNEKDKIVLLDKTKSIDIKKAQWNIIKYNNKFLIQNIFNKKFIEVIDNNIYCMHNIINNLNYYENEKIFINFTFSFQKLFEEYNFNKKFKKFVEKEPIDIVIKYIDLTDISLNRTGIKQIYKDIDNQELKYSIRSILTYIPWIRNIFILMPNERVKYFKTIDEISDKIK